MLDSETCDSCSIFCGLLLLEVEVGGDCHHCILYLRALAAVSLCNFLHVLKDHCRDLFCLEALGLPIDLYYDVRLVISSVFNRKGPQCLILLDNFLVPAASDHPFRIVYRVCWVTSGLVLRCLPYESLTVAEGHIGRRDVHPHVVLNDLHLVLAPYSDARVRRAEINPDPGIF